MPDIGLPKKRVFVCPLDWGLGHTTRCIPIIRALLDMGHEVIIGASGAQEKLLREEFGHLRYVPVPGYHMRYAPHPVLLRAKFPFMVAKVFACAAREHRFIGRFARAENIDLIISDQRFGLHTPSARSIFISHQLCVKMPPHFARVERLVWRALRHAAGRFDELWIPDYPGENNLTGELTRKYPLPPHHRFIGPLSRFEKALVPERSAGPDLLVMLSGPEPQRTILERIVLHQLATFAGDTTVLLGKPGRASPRAVGSSIRLISHLGPADTAKLIATAGAIVCRGGYSTIMELVSMGRTAVLVPTPGQTEQEYLCKRLARQKRFACAPQRTLDLTNAHAQLPALPNPAPAAPGGVFLQNALRDTLCRL